MTPQTGTPCPSSQAIEMSAIGFGPLSLIRLAVLMALSLALSSVQPHPFGWRSGSPEPETLLEKAIRKEGDGGWYNQAYLTPQEQQQLRARASAQLWASRRSQSRLEKLRMKHQAARYKKLVHNANDCESGLYRLDGNIRHYCDKPHKARATLTHGNMSDVKGQISYLKNITSSTMNDLNDQIGAQTDGGRLAQLCVHQHEEHALNISSIYKEIFKDELDLLKTNPGGTNHRHDNDDLEKKKTRFLSKLWEKASIFINPIEANIFNLTNAGSHLQENLRNVNHHLVELFNILVEKNYQSINAHVCQALKCAASVSWRRSSFVESKICNVLKNLEFLLKLIDEAMIDNDRFVELHKRVGGLLLLPDESQIDNVYELQHQHRPQQNFLDSSDEDGGRVINPFAN